ncbi:hypothetical protein MPL3365_110043 [Mesorhizobium plurifarium]|uniref:Uncharacterized protein n=1 Tax=Mesorhizobium plurifarium TaxID=69974 RepID=A0A090FUT0_MESPL|nr:hypothetical protein MPL3365_110043 [Mesorhizobium plurifarium]
MKCRAGGLKRQASIASSAGRRDPFFAAETILWRVFAEPKAGERKGEQGFRRTLCFGQASDQKDAAGERQPGSGITKSGFHIIYLPPLPHYPGLDP